MLEKNKSACYLTDISNCSQDISSEHYISKGVLKNLFSKNTFHVKGLPWITKGKYQEISTASMKSRMLCAKHNNELSILDSEAIKFFEALRFTDREKPSNYTISISGDLIQRWFLKCAFGILSLNSKNPKIFIQNSDKKRLLGIEGWPPPLGMYFDNNKRRFHFGDKFWFRPIWNTTSNHLICSTFNIRGVFFDLWLVDPATELSPQDNPGIYQPQGLCFNLKTGLAQIKFTWDEPRKRKFIFLNRIR